MDAAIYGGDDWFALQKGVGHYLNSASPGENGNMVLTAHNDVYGDFGRHITELWYEPKLKRAPAPADA